MSTTPLVTRAALPLRDIFGESTDIAGVDNPRAKLVGWLRVVPRPLASAEPSELNGLPRQDFSQLSSVRHWGVYSDVPEVSASVRFSYHAGTDTQRLDGQSATGSILVQLTKVERNNAEVRERELRGNVSDNRDAYAQFHCEGWIIS